MFSNLAGHGRRLVVPMALVAGRSLAGGARLTM